MLFLLGLKGTSGYFEVSSTSHALSQNPLEIWIKGRRQESSQGQGWEVQAPRPDPPPPHMFIQENSGGKQSRKQMKGVGSTEQGTKGERDEGAELSQRRTEGGSAHPGRRGSLEAVLLGPQSVCTISSPGRKGQNGHQPTTTSQDRTGCLRGQELS